MTYRRLDLGVMTASLIFVVSCGSSGNSAALSDAEFCQEIARMEAIEPTNDIGGAVDILRDLIAKAPNAEVRKALEVMEPAFEELGKLDQNDPEAMSSFFDLLLDEKIVAAGETLDRYTEEICQFTDSPTNDTVG